MYFGFCGIVISIAIVSILLALDEISEKESVTTKTVDVADGLKHIIISSFDEWCDEHSDIPVPVSSVTKITKTTDTKTTNETDTTETSTETIPEITTISMLIAYGITKSRASILVDAFGDNLFNIAKEGGAKELIKLKGIGDATAAKVVALANQLIPD